jgi:hypothetical protein
VDVNATDNGVGPEVGVADTVTLNDVTTVTNTESESVCGVGAVESVTVSVAV